MLILINRRSDNNDYFKLFSLSKGQADNIVVAQQHRDWAKLGFIRGIAVSPVMCCSLSTSQWVSLLLRVVRGSLPDDDSLPPTVSAVHLPRQVTYLVSEVYSVI